MEHVLLKAVGTVNDAGEFEAVISSASVDRERDVVSPTGMLRAIRRWIPTGKKVPLAWQHSTAAADQIGWIDPKSAHIVGHEVRASGWIDQAAESGQHAWRCVKNGTLGFSFGYLTQASTPRKGGGRNIDEFDIFEVTATNVPMNNDTRVIGWKSEEPPVEVDAEGLRARAEQVEREVTEDALPDPDGKAVEAPERPAEPGVEPSLEPAPDVIDQWKRAVAVEREESAQERASEEATLPVIPDDVASEGPQDAPEAQPGPPPPPASEQRRRAAEAEATASTEDRRTEAAQLPVPVAESADSEADIVPPPAPPTLPPAAEQRERAVEAEATVSAEDRQAEADRLPSEPEEHADETGANETYELAPLAPPEVVEQWQRAVATERDDVRNQRRMDEDRLLGTVPPPPEPPAPEEPPEPVTVRPPDLMLADARRYAQEAVREDRDERERALPATARPLDPLDPDSPKASVSLDRPDVQRRRARRVERETELPVMPPVPEPEDDGDVHALTLALVAQSDFPAQIKDRLTRTAQALHDDEQRTAQAEKALDPVVPAGPPAAPVTNSDLRSRADAIALEFASGGESLRKPPRVKAVQPEPELLPLGELRQRMRDEMLTALSGVTKDQE